MANRGQPDKGFKVSKLGLAKRSAFLAAADYLSEQIGYEVYFQRVINPRAALIISFSDNYTHNPAKKGAKSLPKGDDIRRSLYFTFMMLVNFACREA